MAESSILMGLTAIILLGVGAQWIAWRMNVPSILLLLVAGFVAGPATGLLDPDALLGDLLLPIVSLSVGLILFEGGLTLDMREIRGHGRVVTLLVTLGALVTWVGAGVAAWWILDFSPGLAALLGAILVVTGPTVVGPILRHVQPTGRVGSVIKWEGILIDPVGALLAVLVFEFIITGAPATATGAFVSGLGRAIFVGALTGFLGALVLVLLVRYNLFPDQLQSPLTVAAVVTVFTIANVSQAESGLLATTLMGVLLANQKFVDTRHILEFKENLRVLLLAILFILLAARLDLAALRGLGWESVAFLAVLILIVRPLMVLASTWRSLLSGRERSLVAWMGPRGIVAAAVASLFGLRLQEEGYPGAERLVPVTFLVIVGTVAVYGLTAGPLARMLKLAEPNPQGVLFVGADSLTRAIASAVKDLGYRTLVVDRNPGNVKAARLVGLDAVQMDVLAPDAARHLELMGIGRLAAMTPNDEVNSLAALHFVEVLGRSNVFQVPPTRPEGADSAAAVGPGATDATPEDAENDSAGAVPRHLRGRLLFHSQATIRNMQAWHREGGRVLTLKAPEDFDVDAFVGPDAEYAVPLFVATPGGRLRVVTARDGATVRPGETLVYLARPEDEAAGDA